MNIEETCRHAMIDEPGDSSGSTNEVDANSDDHRVTTWPNTELCTVYPTNC
jgi:hypothetical protein